MIQEAIIVMEIAMSAPIPLRSDFDAASPRALARRSADPDCRARGRE